MPDMYEHLGSMWGGGQDAARKVWTTVGGLGEQNTLQDDSWDLLINYVPSRNLRMLQGSQSFLLVKKFVQASPTSVVGGALRQ
jgi:hypothetical protein